MTALTRSRLLRLTRPRPRLVIATWTCLLRPLASEISFLPRMLGAPRRDATARPLAVLSGSSRISVPVQFAAALAEQPSGTGTEPPGVIVVTGRWITSGAAGGGA